MNKAIFYPSIAAFFSLGSSLAICNFSSLCTQTYWISIVYLLAICLGINFFILLKTDGKTYTERLLGVIVIKFIAALFFILVFGFLNKHVFYKFSAHFLTHYALFIGFEVAYLLNRIKNNNTNNK